ncbi:lymphocyte antigen 6A-2/6E-1 [Nannospalax galili]|uniref:Lymphocyte antigen 6A-2/6E-1 n=1 Tax=Nannospalax galili TaxID=1026970 RepID=A0A8C6QNW1_NANGA|nr:lymphocyte antigen 6A-2/6E-1 [Nannospalax galili]XP_008843178.1 lymphocyte antigen 6A-2/6E-1 [Nannospalax galili]XP_008843179.1 lymphocyte antigen 6A-2/6E-1 [Nannospalax galili]XP_029425130.1 lymphocyte antigen 6A-2/6E-1 [Nannospalax galili]
MNSSYAMKTCALILLVALLCAERAQGLRCYQCLGVTSQASCQPATCPHPDGVCVSQEVEVMGDSQKVKGKNKFCLPDCPKDTSDLENVQFIGTIINSKISCCKGDLCNSAVLVGGSSWALVGALLFSLGGILLQTLL